MLSSNDLERLSNEVPKERKSLRNSGGGDDGGDDGGGGGETVVVVVGGGGGGGGGGGVEIVVGSSNVKVSGVVEVSWWCCGSCRQRCG